MKRRYRTLIFSILEMESPLHIGSGHLDPFTDQPVIRDSRHIPFIPGGTLAGSFGERLDNEYKNKWLGIPKAKNQDAMPSRLIISDAFPVSGQTEALRYPVEIRDLVTILRGTLTAKKDHHFNMEVLPAGTSFCIFCRVDLDTTEEIQSFVSDFTAYLSSGAALGGKVRNGTGCWVATEWTSKTLDLSNINDLKLWLISGHGFQWTGDWNQVKETFGKEPLQLSPIREEEWQMTLEADIDKGLHLMAGASGLPSKNESDLKQANRLKIDRQGNITEEPADYGTSLKGRFRCAMEFLLRTYLIRFFNVKENDVLRRIPVDPTIKGAWDKIADFFGYTGKKGEWWVNESPWTGDVSDNREDHIRLSEFTQQVIDGAKFDFMPLTNGKTSFSIFLPADAPEWQKELISHAGDLWALNMMPWAGHAGRGYLGASVEICFCSPFEPGSLKLFLDESLN